MEPQARSVRSHDDIFQVLVMVLTSYIQNQRFFSNKSMLVDNIFPDIETLNEYDVPPSVPLFSKQFGVGVTLLHSHDGYFELVFERNMMKSRPLKADDSKLTLFPCSFYVSGDNQWIPYEFSVDEVPQLFLTSDLADALRSLELSTGYSYGVTARSITNSTELVDSRCTGGHVYVDRKEKLFPIDQEGRKYHSIVTAVHMDAYDDCITCTDCRRTSSGHESYVVSHTGANDD